MQTMELRGKDVVVLGLGRSGMAAASLLQRDGAHVVVRDESAGDQLQERAMRLRRLGVRVELGNQFDRSTRFDLAVVSPGIGPERPIVREMLTQNTPLLSELELAYRFCLCPIIAITGTNGKTTTTELIAAMLAGCGKRTTAAGNIGNAFSDAVEASAGLDAVVLEVSSFQLEKIEQFRASIAVLLNITPDHLDRYESMDAYAAAKSFIFMNQRPEDTAVVSVETLETLRRMGIAIKARPITFSAYNREADVRLDWFDNETIWCRLPECRGILLKMSETNLRGVHNAENVLATLATGLAMGLPVSECARRSARMFRNRTVRIRGGGGWRDVHQRFEGDQRRCRGEGVAFPAGTLRADRGRSRQGFGFHVAEGGGCQQGQAGGVDRRGARENVARLVQSGAVRACMFHGRGRASGGQSCPSWRYGVVVAGVRQL